MTSNNTTSNDTTSNATTRNAATSSDTTGSDTTSADTQTADASDHVIGSSTGRQRTIALVVVSLGFVMDLLDNTIVNVAVPSIRADLGASYSAIQWLSAGYALAFAVLLITGGRLGDVVGYKPLFLIGVTGFTLASLGSGLAPSIEVLVVARLVQGATAALMAPQVMSLMQVMYRSAERAAVMGIFGALAGISASLGPVIGGLLIEWNIAGLDWRPIFLINVPVGVVAIVAGIRYLPRGKSPHPLHLDVFGTVLIVVALGLLVFPLIQGRELDWPAWVFAMMVASLPVFGVFWWWQRRKMRVDGSPLVIPGLFAIRTFAVGLLLNVVFEMTMLGFFFTFTLVLQIGLGFDVLKAALTGIPVAVGIAVTIGAIAPKLVPRIGRNAIALGALAMGAGLAADLLVLHAGGRDVNAWLLAPGTLVLGAGMGLIMGLVFSATLKDVDPAHAGSASGTLSAVQQVGGAIGIALIGVIFFGAVAGDAGPSFDTVAKDVRSSIIATGAPEQAADKAVAELRTCFVDRVGAKDPSVEPASCRQVQAASGGNRAVGAEISSAVATATGTDFTAAFGATVGYVGILLALLIGGAFLLPRKLDFGMGGH